MTKKIIAIVGLMGVGKTTIGTKLAEKIGYYFIDSDQEIEDLEGISISQIFSNFGEKYFREVEKKIIAERILRNEEMVLSLGGGAFIDEETRKILKEKATIIWLKAPLEIILYRIGAKGTRPLLNHKNKKLVLEELAAKRYPIYAEADFSFDTDKEAHEVLVKKIIEVLKL